VTDGLEKISLGMMSDAFCVHQALAFFFAMACIIAKFDYLPAFHGTFGGRFCKVVL